MAYAGYAPDVWSETAYVTVRAESGNPLNFKTITDSFKPEIGEKGFETIATIGGGRLVKFTPEEDSSVTFELFPINAANDWSSTLGEEATGFFDLLHTHSTGYSPSTQGLVSASITNDVTRTRYRVCFLWTNASVSNAESAVSTASKAGLRIIMCGYFTKVDPDFSDDSFKVTLTMKCPAFKKDGTANVKVESTDNGSTSLTAPAAFTSSVNW